MITNIDGIETYSEDDYNNEINSHFNYKSIDLLKLKQKLNQDKKKVLSKKYINVVYRSRSEIVSQITKIRANGICDLCENKAPFILNNGNPFLETHHLVWLANGGADDIWNTVALCPNCHRKVHNITGEDILIKLKNKIYKYLLNDGDAEKCKIFKSYWKEEF